MWQFVAQLIGFKKAGVDTLVTDAEPLPVVVSNPTANPETGLAKEAKQLPDNHNVTVSNPTANPETGLAKEITLQEISDRSEFPLPEAQVSDLKIIASESLVKKTIAAASSGDNALHTPTGTNKIRLYFFGYSAGANVSGVLAGLKLAGYNGDAVFDQQYLIAPGQPYARNIQGGKRYVEGGAGGALTLNLSAAQTVYTNIELEEVA